MLVTKEQKEVLGIMTYLLYKLNFLSRNNVKQLFEIMSQPGVDDPIQYLMDEIAKMNPPRKG